MANLRHIGIAALLGVLPFTRSARAEQGLDRATAMARKVLTTPTQRTFRSNDGKIVNARITPVQATVHSRDGTIVAQQINPMTVYVRSKNGDGSRTERAFFVGPGKALNLYATHTVAADGSEQFVNGSTRATVTKNGLTGTDPVTGKTVTIPLTKESVPIFRYVGNGPFAPTWSNGLVLWPGRKAAQK